MTLKLTHAPWQPGVYRRETAVLSLASDAALFTERTSHTLSSLFSALSVQHLSFFYMETQRHSKAKQLRAQALEPSCPWPESELHHVFPLSETVFSLVKWDYK